MSVLETEKSWEKKLDSNFAIKNNNFVKKRTFINKQILQKIAKNQFLTI